jgi:hypothetical protein
MKSVHTSVKRSPFVSLLPFILPQEDPSFYESYLRIHNVPELVTEPVPQRPHQLLDATLHMDRML